MLKAISKKPITNKKMLWSIAWKNVWRNKLRSLIVIIAVMLGIFAGSFTVGLMNGVGIQRTQSVIHNEISHIQIHNKAYAENDESKYTIDNTAEITDFLQEKLPGYVGATSRLAVMGMATDGSHNTGIKLIGINPDDEKKVTDIYEKMRDSSDTYFEADKKNQVVIGEALAKKLYFDRYLITDSVLLKLQEIGLEPDETQKLDSLKGEIFRRKDEMLSAVAEQIGQTRTDEFEYWLKKLSLTFKNRMRFRIDFTDSEGSQATAAFNVSGIYKINNTSYEEFNVFADKDDLARLTGFPVESAHQIAVLLDNKDKADEAAEAIKAAFPDLDVKTWGEINPELIMLTKYLDFYNYAIVGLILFALAFGIVNTMLMAIMERTKELGMLAAVGMNRKRIFSMIMLETVFLTVVGALVGMAINALAMTRLEQTGLDLSESIGEGFEAIGYDAVMYPIMETQYYIGIGLLVIFTAVLSSVYPAVKALKLKPADAVRADV